MHKFNLLKMALPKPNIVPYSIPVPNNMGVVRYVLAFSVIVAHFYNQT